MHRRTRERGFTLVELAASGIAVAVALIGTTAALISSVKLTDATNRTRESARTVGSLVEEIRNADFDDLVTNYHDTRHDVSNGDAAISISDITPRSASRWKLYRVEVEVDYGESVADGSLRFVTYVSDRHESSGLSGVSATAADVPQEDGQPIDVPDDPPPEDPPPTDPPPTGNGNGH